MYVDVCGTILVGAVVEVQTFHLRFHRRPENLSLKRSFYLFFLLSGRVTVRIVFKTVAAAI